MPATSVIPVGVLSVVKDKCAECIEGCPGKVRNVWGYASFPDHNNKRCIDFMIYNRAGGDAVAQYIIDNAERLGLKWLIWNRRIYRHQSSNGHGWDRYHGSNPHTDHVHAEFDNNPVKGGSKPKRKPNKRKARMVATGEGRRKVRILAGAKEGGWFWGTRYVNVDKLNKVRAKGPGHFNRHIWYLQRWLVQLGYGQSDGVEATGFWNRKTQLAYNDFRRKYCDYSGDDATGSVGVQSLTQLQQAADKASAKHIN